MRKLTQLWQTLEKIPGLLGVTAAWQEACGDDFGFLRQFLRSTDTLGSLYPCPFPTRGYCPRKIIDHGDGDLVAICRDPHQVCPNVAIDASAALLHELNLAAFTNAISTVLGIQPQQPKPRFAGVWGIGLSTRALTRGCAAFLLIHARQPAFVESLRRLALEVVGRFLVLAPTGAFLDVECQQLLRSRRITFIALEESILRDDAGQLVAVDQSTSESGGDAQASPDTISRRPGQLRKSGRPRALPVNGNLVKQVRGDLKQEDFARSWGMSVDRLQTAENENLATMDTIAKIVRAARAKGLKLKPENLTKIVPQKPRK